ncbi:ATP12 family chaperone protein [Actibacterium lipolyticum]|uniref:ATP12 chaperone protein n=1 Tax=Actibacterium lipolyticum TaxID=1524263 RepID=A0A238JK07_9RHOB|nr:ATP12 family protein [Actibacterium lipolyticum]SMX30989.1 ATP12 chaperone protein [Actibacterium lipolyticum]
MSGWKNKRFWKEATCAEVEGGFAVHLDGRVVKTPAKSALTVPTLPMAQEIAAEWDAQGEEVDPLSMPVTRSANAAIDKVTPQHSEVAEMIAAYGGTDLLCYRAESPVELIARQAQAWDPLLKRAEREFAAPLSVTAGVMHCAQPEDSLRALSKRVSDMTPFELTALHDLVALSGSLIIGLATMEGWEKPEELWRISRLDETWQEEQWGPDDEATELAETKRESFFHAFRFYNLARTPASSN